MASAASRVGYGQPNRKTSSQDTDTAESESLESSPFLPKARISFSPPSPRKGYIVDFVCLKHGLVVKIDGGQHNLQAHATADEKRDQTLVRSGFRVLRFWNSDVDSNLDGVLETIDAALMASKPHPAAFGGHPPFSGEG